MALSNVENVWIMKLNANSDGQNLILGIFKNQGEIKEINSFFASLTWGEGIIPTEDDGDNKS